MVPVVPVKYCRHPFGAAVLLLHGIWVTLMVNAVVEAPLDDPKFALSVLHVLAEHAGTYMCSPVFVPQINGGAFPPQVVTWKESTWHCPILLAVPAAEVVGPWVTVDTVTGLLMAKVSKSRRS